MKCKTCGKEISDLCDWNQGRCPNRVERDGVELWWLFIAAVVVVIVFGIFR